MTTLTDEQDAGSTDLSQQLRTYHGFLIGIRYVVLAFIVAGSFLILTFCTGAGFWGGLVVAAIVVIAGVYFAKRRTGDSWVSQVATLVMSTEAESGHPIEDRVAARKP